MTLHVVSSVCTCSLFVSGEQLYKTFHIYFYFSKIGNMIYVQSLYIHGNSHLRGLWRLGVVKSLVIGADGVTRGAEVCAFSKTGRPIVLRRPIQHLYPLEVTSQQVLEKAIYTEEDDQNLDIQKAPTKIQKGCSQQTAALQAKDQIPRFLIN